MGVGITAVGISTISMMLAWSEKEVMRPASASFLFTDDLNAITAQMHTHYDLYRTPAPIRFVWVAGRTPRGDLWYVQRVPAAWIVIKHYRECAEWLFASYPPTNEGERNARGYALWRYWREWIAVPIGRAG